ncbi:MAG: DMT family transporter [Siphonobacter aquaeclarae]|nr:DMT family transporter [Siphonobacter aquaeclarae]
MKPTLRDYVQLHFLVLIFGFTAILGRLVSIPALTLVLWRTGLAAACMWGLYVWKKTPLFSSDLSSPEKRNLQVRMLGTGAIIAAHWILFFGSARVSNVSVCLAGLSTASLWTAFLEPLFSRKRVSPLEVCLGLLVILGLYLIFLFEFNHALGLAMSVASAMLSALFSVFNSHFSKRVEPTTITTYEMTGAWVSTAFFLPVYYLFLAPGETPDLVPHGDDWLWVGILALVCTVYAYAAFVRLFRTFTAFVLNLSLNMEPIYGILLAFVIFGDAEKMTGGFYAGASLIFGAVVLYPILNRWSKQEEKTASLS